MLLANVRSRLQRAAQMERSELTSRIRQKLSHRFGYWPNVRRVAFALDRYSRRRYDRPYEERAEAGPVNLEVKLARLAAGGPFEPYNIALVNRAVVSLLEPHHRRIFEIGSGTGMFASLASRDTNRRIVASESNAGAREWARQHRSAPNIDYCDRDLQTVGRNEFDAVVAIEVIEHIAPFAAFLRELSRVAPEAFLTTPNKGRDAFSSVARTPAYSEHVREWTAGEFYWVLRAFYERVELFTVPDQQRQIAALRSNSEYMPRLDLASDLCAEELLIARCRHPLR
jgi:2-polyprenyl-3-methyl-5-hydroxy-6-metoxy-1,4-benzoquinol methylase